MISVARQMTMNRLTRINKQKYVERRKEAYRMCIKNSEIFSRQLEEIQRQNIVKK